jgi:urease subunit gamma
VVLVARGGEDEAVHLTPRELDKLMILSLAQIANARRGRGIKLNHPEAAAVISAAALEGAREGKSVEDVMHDAAHVLTTDDVMEGVAHLIPMIQVEAVFTDGSRLVTIHSPIQ